MTLSTALLTTSTLEQFQPIVVMPTTYHTIAMTAAVSLRPSKGQRAKFDYKGKASRTNLKVFAKGPTCSV